MAPSAPTGDLRAPERDDLAAFAEPPPVPPLAPPPSAAPSPRRTRRGLVIAGVVPAIAAGALVLALTGGEGEPVDGDLSAPALARLADLSPAVGVPRQPEVLHPVVPVEGRLGIRVDPLEPLEGGIRPAPPGRIRIPAADIDAGVEAVQTRRDGIEVPAEGWAGWYDGGPRPGEPGRAVLIGHLDSKEGPGVFARVPTLREGAEVEIVDNRGQVHAYRVVGVTRVEKRRFPTEAVYGHARRPVLVLVTCGGPYEEGRGYRDNVLVYARAA